MRVDWKNACKALSTLRARGKSADQPKQPARRNTIGAPAEYVYSLEKNLAFDSRGVSGEISKIPNVVQEFKANGVDVMLAIGYPAALAAKTAGIPTVIAFGAGDPGLTPDKWPETMH